MVAIRTNLFATLLSIRVGPWVRADDGKEQRDKMGIDWIFFTTHKRFVDDICTHGIFENMYAGLKLCMVGIRTVLFATLSRRVGARALMLRVSEVRSQRWE